MYVDYFRFIPGIFWVEKIEFINSLVAVLGPRDMATETANISMWKIFVDLLL